MKYFLCFALIAVAAAKLYTQDELNHMKEIGKECLTETHVDENMVKEMRKRHFHDDAKLKDYLFCSFKKMDWMDDHGVVHKDKLETTMSKNSIAKTAMDACIDKHGSTGPETAFMMYKCWIEHLPADFHVSEPRTD